MYQSFTLLGDANSPQNQLSLRVHQDKKITLFLNDEQYSIEPVISKVALGKLIAWFRVCEEFYPVLCEKMRSCSEHRFQTSSNSYLIDVKLTHQPFGQDNQHLIRVKIGQCVFETSHSGIDAIVEILSSLEEAVKYYDNIKSVDEDKDDNIQDELF